MQAGKYPISAHPTSTERLQRCTQEQLITEAPIKHTRPNVYKTGCVIIGPGAHRVKPVVDEMLQVLTHADLPHQLVLVSVHSGELPDVGKDVVQAVGQLSNRNMTIHTSEQHISTVKKSQPPILKGRKFHA